MRVHLAVRCLVALAMWGTARALTTDELPATDSARNPALLLCLGSEPAPPTMSGLSAVTGGLTSHEGCGSVKTNAEEVVLHRGDTKGRWAASFRFALPPGHPAGDFTFWARWKQGGDPRTSEQAFEVWAGPDVSSLEKRSAMAMPAASWSYAWRDGKTLTVKPEDTVLEVRNSGNGQTAKVFSAFLLGGPKPPPPPVELPVSGTADGPAIAFGFGRTPLNRSTNEPSVLVYAGTIVDRTTNVLYASIGGDVATVAHKGLGEWGATLQFDLADRPIPPGYYAFHARYMSGGEPSQTRQTFTVTAGPNRQTLGVRGTFQTQNRTPFQHQWVAGTGTLILLPGDKVVQVVNSGKAHDAKVFSGFAFGLEKPLPAWFTVAHAERRAGFLAHAQKVGNAEVTLHVLDGEGPDAALFAGLAQESLGAFYGSNDATYLLGESAEALAREVGLSALPAAILSNRDRRILGVLSKPASPSEVVTFVTQHGRGGFMPPFAEIQPAPVPVKDGVLESWLVATGWPGRCGVGHWGLDAESLQRPNPGDRFGYGFYTAGTRSGTWTERRSDNEGTTWIVDRLPESYAWGKGTSYAVAYLHADAPATVRLHFQHSGIQSAVCLEGAAQPLRDDPDPPVTLRVRTAAQDTAAVDRPGQETHDDRSVPETSQPPQVATLALPKGWSCLVLKMVHAQGKDDSVLFAARLTDAAGAPPVGLSAQTADPTVPLGMARGAAGLWPLLTLEGVPGNLPRPGEPLTVVADLRIPEQPHVPRTSFMERFLPGLFLSLDATLRVRVADYDGKEVQVVEASGTFPGVVKLDLGPAPAPGFYALIPELVAADGRLIRRFHPDGFSVVLGNAAQKERVDRKELMNSYYYAFNDWETLAPWLERVGMLKNVGSTPGISGKDVAAKWADAKARGIVLFADFAGDSNWLNNSDKDGQALVELAPAYTRFFKSVNEIDGRWRGEEGVAWDPARTPETWVARAKSHHEAVHKARPDALYFGGSLYCSGVDREATAPVLGPRAWFRKCLELGLDKYIDAWDVHAYPQFPPQLETPSLSNSPHETDLGVIEVLKEVGKVNTKPFLLGETSALVWHGFDGMRWQAATLAKMTAWTNSREDWMGIALCAAQRDRRITGEEYAMARNPGEAAVYTAGALIDGLPYRRVQTEGKDVQAAWFGETFMVWRADDHTSDYALTLAGAGPWVIVDVVGRVKPLAVQGGTATITIGTSPVYVLPESHYHQLTRME
jgi:hypothetical protein